MNREAGAATPRRTYDATLKSLFLKSPPTLLDRVIPGRKITQALNVEFKRVRPVKERAVDLLFLLDDGTLLQIEFQTLNDNLMDWRMLEYKVEVALNGESRVLHQLVIYTGNETLRMKNEIRQQGLEYRFDLLDIRDLDARELLKTGRLSDTVLAFLAGGFEDSRTQLAAVFGRIQSLDAPLKAQAFASLLLLSPLRNSETMVKETLMTAEVELDWRKNPVLREWAEELAEIIREERINERIGEELRKILVTQISARFGFVPALVHDRIQAASVPQLEEWLKRLFDASNLDELIQ